MSKHYRTMHLRSFLLEYPGPCEIIIIITITIIIIALVILITIMIKRSTQRERKHSINNEREVWSPVWIAHRSSCEERTANSQRQQLSEFWCRNSNNHHPLWIGSPRYHSWCQFPLAEPCLNKDATIYHLLSVLRWWMIN